MTPSKVARAPSAATQSATPAAHPSVNFREASSTTGTGASGEIAETVLELARAMDRSLYVQKREQKLAYYRTSGRAKHNANVKAHYAQRRERILEYMRAYRAAHRDEIHAYNRAYHAAHRLKTQLI